MEDLFSTFSADHLTGDVAYCDVFGVACVQAPTQRMSRVQKLLYGMWHDIMANTKIF